jgi:hypothetical protein
VHHHRALPSSEPRLASQRQDPTDVLHRSLDLGQVFRRIHRLAGVGESHFRPPELLFKKLHALLRNQR